MTDINYDADLLGYIVSDKGISLEAWESYAGHNKAYVRNPPRTFKNPFTGQNAEVESTAFKLVENNAPIGLFVWEATECVGVAGDLKKVNNEIKNLCRHFSAKFEDVEDEVD